MKREHECSGGNRMRKRVQGEMVFQGLGHADWLNLPHDKLKICVSYLGPLLWAELCRVPVITTKFLC